MPYVPCGEGSTSPANRRVCGNAAIEGASIALLSKTKRRELEELVRRVEHCRLETHPQFFDFFVEGCQFKPVESAATHPAQEAHTQVVTE